MTVLKFPRRKRPIVAPLVGTIPTVGFISASGEFQHGQPWSLLATDSLYRSAVGGKRLETVLDETGSTVKPDVAKAPQRGGIQPPR